MIEPIHEIIQMLKDGTPTSAIINDYEFRVKDVRAADNYLRTGVFIDPDKEDLHIFDTLNEIEE